jgi:hypothetical protein
MSLTARLDKLEAQLGTGTGDGLPRLSVLVHEVILLESWLAGQGLTLEQAAALGLECPQCRYATPQALLPDAGEGVSR